jgi:hypothetical protein
MATSTYFDCSKCQSKILPESEEIDKLALKSIWKCKNLEHSEQLLKKKDSCRTNTTWFQDLKLQPSNTKTDEQMNGAE